MISIVRFYIGLEGVHMRNRYKWLERLDAFFVSYLITGRVILIFLLLSVAFFYLHVVFPETTNLYSVKNSSLMLDRPTGVLAMPEGGFVVNDSDQKLVLMDSEGRLIKAITCSNHSYFSDIAVDSDGNIYTIVSRMDESESTLYDQTVVKYTAEGKKELELFAVDYTEELEDHSNCNRKILLELEAGVLYVIQYGEHSTSVAEIDTVTGEVTQIGQIPSATVFLYSHVYYLGEGRYNYVKFTGEIGRGEIGGEEQILWKHAVTMNDLNEARASFIYECPGEYIIRDNWSKKLYHLSKDEGSSLAPWNPVFEGKELGDDVAFTTMSNGVFCAVSQGSAWVMRDETIELLPAVVKISTGQALLGHLKNILPKLFHPLQIVFMVICIFLVLFKLLLHGNAMFWKVFIYSAILCTLSLGVVEAIYRQEQVVYLEDMMRQSQALLRMAKASIDIDIFEAATHGDFFETEMYAKIREQLVEEFGEYKNGSEEAVVLMIPLKGRNHAIDIASNRGKNDLSHVQSYVVGLAIADITYDNPEFVTYYDKHIISGIGFYNEQQELIGYFCRYEPFAQIQNRFMSMWTNSTTYILLGVILLATYLFSWMFTRRFNRLQDAINKIAEGNLEERVREDYEDELGDISKAINRMTERIGELLAENAGKNEEIRKSQQEVLISLSSITEAKSGETGNHVRRVGEYVKILAADFGFEGKELEYLSTAAMLHDVGKLMVPPGILEKPGKLTEEEFEIVKLHAADGEALLKNAPGQIMHYARIIALEHHEKWNGKGYAGIKGEAIHVEARITAVADVFDALVSERCYKPAMSVEDAYQVIIKERGEHFDPAVVDSFVRHFEEIKEVQRKYSDVTKE